MPLSSMIFVPVGFPIVNLTYRTGYHLPFGYGGIDSRMISTGIWLQLYILLYLSLNLGTIGGFGSRSGLVAHLATNSVLTPHIA